MQKKRSCKLLSVILAVIMLAGMLPVSAFAAGSVTNYADFLTELKQLETYAAAYYSGNAGKSEGELILNFIRTGVERYLDGNWSTLAGQEITAFTQYVEEQDAAKGTTVMRLRDIEIENFTLPNGNKVDFGHMFGTMNISYVNKSNARTADLAGWAGDLCDLLYYCAERATVEGDNVDEQAAYILEKCFGVDADDAFGWDDFYGDMDAYYLVNEYFKGNGSFSELAESYFTAELSDADRAAYFLNNRFPGKTTKEEVRTAIYDTYRSNPAVQILEADRGVTDCSDLRKASCYAFADYLFAQADGRLEGGNEGEDDEEEDELPANGYYSVFSSTESILAPGVTQQINYAMSADGKQMVYYVATVDVTRDDLTIKANYNNNDPSKGWAMQRVQDQVAAMVKNHADVENFTPVVATNGDGFNTSTGKPGGLLVMEGVEWHPVDGDGFFAILKDGSAMIGTKADYEIYKDQIEEAIGAFGATLVKDGKIAVNKSSNYYASRASRTAIGIKADGSVVMMVLDGRQEPFSCGGSMEEIAQIMYEAGCVNAVNLDGGGSTTYMSKPEGSDEIKVVNRPSDGYARSVAATLVAVSTAKSSKEFDRAIIESEYDYLTAGTSIAMKAIGVNNIGSSAEIPEGATWEVSDESIGTITADGVFTAAANGDVDVLFKVNGELAGSKSLHVVVPDTLEFEDDTLVAVYGEPMTFPINAYHNGNPVMIKAADLYMNVQYSNAGTMNGFVFTPYEDFNLRNIMCGAMLLANQNVYALANIALYRKDEVVFDFENATVGNRTLAWNRDLENAEVLDEMNYSVVELDKEVEIDYTFALDMMSIEIPEKLKDIVYMLPGADNTEISSSAFNYLLMLAERVSVLTEVKITAQFDNDIEVDVSGLKIINDYFELKEATVDENNNLTIICNWIDRSEPIPVETANPVCILTGIKAKTAADANWADDELVVINTGSVSYDIYLRASSLYSFANLAENQQKYDLYPYTADFTASGGMKEQGAHLADPYAEFEDSFILKRIVRQGWHSADKQDYYYVDNEPLTGIQYIPAKKDADKKLFYRFDENGVCLGTCTGAIEYNGDLYCAINGEMNVGWYSTDGENGNTIDYYFAADTGKAVDGKQKIDGYNYTFENNILVKGDLVKDDKGTRYRWAGNWLHGQWFEVDGNWYCTKRFNYYVVTGFVSVSTQGSYDTWKWHLFDENGVFRSDYNGLYIYNGDTYYIMNGLRDSTVGLVYEDGYYYYISSSDAKACKNVTRWVNNTNGLIPAGKYSFDEYGRMIDPPVETPDTPGAPDTPPVLKNGIYYENGNYRYYQDGKVDSKAGVVKLADENGKEFYIYVSSSTGCLATGTYWPSKTNGLLPSGMYDFGDDGRYYPPEETPDENPDTDPEPSEKKNGVIREGDYLRYYVDGVLKSGLGLVKLTDEVGITYYIYVCSNGLVATDVYWPTTLNGLLERGPRNFGKDGRYYPPAENPDEPAPELKNGIYKEDEYLYYYIDGVRQVGNGMVKLTDENGKDYYIYVRSNGQLATNNYWPTTLNGLLERGPRDFGEDGRYYPPEETPDENPDTDPAPELKNGIYKEDEYLYYYIDGVRQSGNGLVKLTDENGKDYYIYVRSNAQVATGIYWPTTLNGLLERGPRDFGIDGRYYPA